ncbi:MAG: hypothetical protein ACI9ES_003617 [Oceanospirillaceae bacterium]|jgi:hypothetical protein
MKYKKGQIVPRYLVQSVEPKARHLIKFGADVQVFGRKIIMLSKGCAIYLPATTHVLKKKRQKTVKGFVFVDLSVVGFGESTTFVSFD